MLLFIFYTSALCQLVSLSHAQCDVIGKKTISLNATHPGGDPSAGVWGEVWAYADHDTTVVNDEWQITAADDIRYHAMKIDISKSQNPGAWGFHATAPSTIVFKLHSTTTAAQSSPANDLALVVIFADGNLDASKYFSSLIQISANYETNQPVFNAIGPSCDSTTNPTETLYGGKIKDIMAETPAENADDRWKRAGLTGATRQDTESWLPQRNGVQEWPITFTLKNYPNDNKVLVSFEAKGASNTPTPATEPYEYRQSCGFGDTFANDTGFYVYFHADKGGQTINVNQIDIEYWYDCTSAPTKNPSTEPTSQPTLNPSTNPTFQPTNEPTTDPTFQPTRNPTTNPTLQPTQTPTNPTRNPTLSPTLNPSSAPIHALELISGRWSDDRHVILYENPGVYTYDELLDQGWVIFNGQDLVIGGTMTEETQYQIDDDDIASGANTLLKNLNFDLTTTQDSIEFMGPFARRMLINLPKYDWIYIARNFMCDSEATPVVSFSFWFCREGNADNFGLDLEIEHPTQSKVTYSITIPTATPVPTRTPYAVACNNMDERYKSVDNVAAFPTAVPTAKFQVRLIAHLADNKNMIQFYDVGIWCKVPTSAPTVDPTAAPTLAPSLAPSVAPTLAPSVAPTTPPSLAPSLAPSVAPSLAPSTAPSSAPSLAPSLAPSIAPSLAPTLAPSLAPSLAPTLAPSLAPSLTPSGSPSQPPTSAPSLAPSIAPSLAPTDSPLTCPDYTFYPPVDGLDYTLDFDAMTSKTRVSLGPNAMSRNLITVELLEHPIQNCTATDGCHFNCTQVAACYRAEYTCYSRTGCNLRCSGSEACGSMQFYATQVMVFPQTPTDGTLSPTLPPTSDPTSEPTAFPPATQINASLAPNSQQIHIECYDDACPNMQIYISSVQSAHIHCRGERACTNMRVHFMNISARNNHNTSITCYVENACDGLNITADGELSKLHMYAYSKDIVFENGYGWAFSEDTITCDMDSKFIKYGYNAADGTLSQLTRLEYGDESSDLPCEGITVHCTNADAAGSCEMTYVFTSPSRFDNLPDNNLPRFTNSHCVYIALRDLLNLQCQGSCQGSPTLAPTISPSGSPSQPPSKAPSGSPSQPPSSSPSQPPSAAPTFAPSISPSLAPTNAPSIAPSFSPSAAPTIAPSSAPSDAPTFSPTMAPTRPPTLSGIVYDVHTYVIYRFINMTTADCDAIYNDSSLSIVPKIANLIEQNYFDGNVIQKFAFFQLKINKINGHNVQKKTGQLKIKDFQLEWLYDLKHPHTGLREMHAKSTIDHTMEYQTYFEQKTYDLEFWQETTASFREYFKNPYLNFTVANESLTWKVDVPVTELDVVFIALNILLGTCVLIGIAAKIHNKMGEKAKCLTPVDNARWFAVLFFGLQIYDVISDINLTTEIFAAIFNRECESEEANVYCAGDQNLETDDAAKFDTLQEYALLVSGVMSALFLVVPYGLNVAYAAKVPNSEIIQKNTPARTWFEQYQTLFIGLVVISGGCYPAMALVSSNVFGISLLNCGLCSFELTALSDIRVITTVLTENGPQLIVQILFSYAINDLTRNTMLAFATSIVSIVASVLNFFINKDKEGQVNDIYYFFEMKLNDQNKVFSIPEKQYIGKRKGVKAALEHKIIKTYGDIDISNFEVGYVTIRKNNFVIRVIQHLHEQDIGNKGLSEEELSKIVNVREREIAKLKPFKAHCHELYFANRTDIENIIYTHYKELDRRHVTFRYHREYPKEKTTEALLRSKDRSKNFQDLIRQNTGKSLDFDAMGNLNSMGMDSLDLDNFDLEDMVGDDFAEQIGINVNYNLEGGGKEKKKKKKAKPGGHVQGLIDHRKQFKEAFKLITQELAKQKEKNKYAQKAFGTTQINEFISMLKKRNMETAVIEDVLHYATESGLFSAATGNDSGIDVSVEYDSQNNEVTDPKQKRLIRMRELTRTLEPHPEWFVSNMNRNQSDSESSLVGYRHRSKLYDNDPFPEWYPDKKQETKRKWLPSWFSSKGKGGEKSEGEKKTDDAKKNKRKKDVVVNRKKAKKNKKDKQIIKRKTRKSIELAMMPDWKNYDGPDFDSDSDDDDTALNAWANE